MPSLEKYIQDQLEFFSNKGQRRILHHYHKTSPTTLQKENKEYLSFNDNDYFNLSTHPEVIARTKETIEQYGIGTRASRLQSGNHPLYRALENLLAQSKGTEASLVFGSGYLTNIGVIPALVGKGDLIIADKLIHACLIDGAKLSGAKLVRFSHNDPTSCQRLLQKHRRHYRHCLILTETVFSMDGDVAPVAKLFSLANQFDAYLLTDDAHGFGLFDHHTMPAHIHVGTLSKAIGCYGGYVCASQTIIDYLINTARSFIYSTALPTPILAGAAHAITILNNSSHIKRQPIDNAIYFTKEMDLPLAQSAIVPYIIGTSYQALQVSAQLEKNNILAQAIRPPTVPLNTARLRLTFSAAHTKNDLNKLIRILKEITDNA